MALTQTIESGSFKRTAAALAYEKAQMQVSQATEKGGYAQLPRLKSCRRPRSP